MTLSFSPLSKLLELTRLVTILLVGFCFARMIVLGQVMTYTGFGNLINFNPNFLAIFVVISMSFSLWSLLFSEQSSTRTVYDTFCVFLLSAGLILLTSRMAIITFVLVTFFLVYHKLRESRKVKYILLPISLLAFILMGLFSHKMGSVRTNNLVRKLDYKNANKRDGRWNILEATINCIKKKPFFGYGYKNAQLALNQEYHKNGFENALKKNYHSHNQFLQLALYGGIPCGVLLLIIIWSPSIFKTSILSTTISSIFTLTFLTDCPLQDPYVLVMFSLLILAQFVENTSIAPIKIK